MRPNHNNNKQRMRGRPQNNRRGPNPLTRSYESNGPDVKIRGNAHHVAEKYLQLARDAHTGGDPVAAENYLQHAEHYYRLIASAQAAQALAASGRPPGEGEGEDGEEDEEFGDPNDRFASPLERQAALAPQQNPPQPAFPPSGVGPAQPQPNFDARPQGEREPFQPRDNNNNYQQRGNFRQDRQPRQDRQNGQDFRGQPREPQKPREFRIFHDYAPRPEAAAQPEAEAAPGLPSFITAAPRANPAPEPVESPRESEFEAAQPSPEAPRAPDEAAELDVAAPRGRRRRLRSPYGIIRQNDEDGGEGPVGQG